MGSRDFVVLLVEDSKHDILATRRAWKAYDIRSPLYVVRDGEECLDYLYKRGKYSEPGSAPEPGVLILDIKMPKMDGLTVLERIRADDRFRHLPITIFTTSDADEDRRRSYSLGANAVIRKPVGFESFASTLRTINLFWQLVDPPDDSLTVPAT